MWSINKHEGIHVHNDFDIHTASENYEVTGYGLFHILGESGPVNGENHPLVANEPIEFETTHLSSNPH